MGDCGVPAGLDRLVVAGQSLGGLSALYAALEFPELVSRVACRSGSFWWAPGAGDLPDPLGGAVGGAVAERLRRGADLSRLRCAFDVGEHETRMLPHCELTESLTERAGATVRVSRSASDHDRAGWRHALLRDVAWAWAELRAGAGGCSETPPAQPLRMAHRATARQYASSPARRLRWVSSAVMTPRQDEHPVRRVQERRAAGQHERGAAGAASRRCAR